MFDGAFESLESGVINAHKIISIEHLLAFLWQCKVKTWFSICGQFTAHTK